MQGTKKLELRAKPTQPVQINKPVALTIAAVVILSILLAIIYAFNTPVNTKKIASNNIKINNNKPVLISPELNNLPSSYSDINAIQRYSSSNGSQISELTQLQQQLNELKNSYDILKQQLNTTNQNGSEKAAKSPQDEQAKTSSVVFPGLGTGAEKLIDSDSDKDRTPFGRKPSDKPIDLIATQKQGEFFEKQGENAQKLAVMKAAIDNDRPEDIYDLHSIIKPFSKYQVQAGTIIQATLITGIDTSQAGTIVAQVRQDIYDTVTGKHLLIPKGSKLLGEYDSRSVSYGQRRIAMWYTRIVRPDGSSILLGRPTGADLLGRGGVEGNVDNHWARIIGSATISTILSVGTAMWANRTSNNGSSSITTNQQNAAAGVGQAVTNVGDQISSKSLGIPPTISLPPGHQFTVTVKKDMVMAPYKFRRL